MIRNSKIRRVGYRALWAGILFTKYHLRRKHIVYAFLILSIVLIPSSVSFDQNRLGTKTFVTPNMKTTPTLPAMPKREQFFNSWPAIHQLLTSITQGEHELQYFGSFTNNIPIGFIQQVNAATKTVTANGNAKIDTSQSEFGGASGKFVSSSSSYLSIPDSADWFFGAADFTIDFWVRFNTLPGSNGRMPMVTQVVSGGIFQQTNLFNNGGTYQWEIWIYNTTQVHLTRKNAIVSTGVWYHVAFVRSGNSWMVFQGGTQVGTTDTDSALIPDFSASLSIGSDNGISNYLDGWLDEVRISNSARWTSNFTPPTSEYVSDSHTVLLLHMDGANGSTTFIDDSAVTGPDFSISASPASQAIGAGGSASSTLTLTALGGYFGTVDLVITSGCSAAGMGCTLNGGSTASVSGGSGTVTLAVNTLVTTPSAAYPVVVTGTDHVNSAITHQTTFTVTVGTTPSYFFNVKGTSTQIVVTLTYSWSGSGTPPQGFVIISAPSGTVCSPSCSETAGAVYDRTSIAVSTAGNTYSIIHRVTFTITPPGTLPAWTAYVALSGVSSYTVTIEVS
jgi:hypothetical protein